MTENNQFFVHVDGQLVPVTEEVYLAYYRSKRRMRYYERDIKTESAVRDKNGNIIGYKPAKEDSLDRLKEIGEDFADNNENAFDTVFRADMADKLNDALCLLTESEHKLIEALFFLNSGYGMTVREYANKSGIPFTTIQSRKAKILAKLKKLMGN